METFTLSQVNPHDAAAVLRAAGLIDPAHLHTPETIAECGQAFKLTTAGGEGVFVAEKRGPQLWIHGAGGVASKGLTGVGLQVIEALAKQAECGQVAFQTGRPGLARLAKKSGYRISGFILEKSV